MAILRFNRAVLNGTEVTIEDFVNGSGVINYIAYDKSVTTFNHAIHHVRLSISANAEFTAWGDKRDLNTDSTSNDSENFGGTHTFYYDTTEVISFKGLVTTEYSPDERQTTISITGEADGIE